MSSSSPNSFDDPHLHKLCCQAWRHECASQTLRRRLAQSLGSDEPIKLSAWQRPLSGLAAAAIILLAFGFVASRKSKDFRSVAAENASLNDLADEMTETHDGCVAHALKHQWPGVPLTNLAMLDEVLSNQLHQPVLVSALPESGWHFRGGTICNVGQTPSAHLIFDRDGASISVFSLPASVGKTYAISGPYELVEKDHPMAGVVDGRGTFCLVASGPNAPSADHLAALRNRIEPQITQAPPRQTVASAELLLPTP